MATITADLAEGYRVRITNGRHEWRADEPTDLGGTDLGPNPYELLLGALASCTSITLSMYAARKGMQLESISVQYEFDRVHADDCETCDDDATGFVERVSSQIFVEGDFTEEERERLAQIARRCPVHTTLDNGVHFEEEVIVG